MAYQNTFKRYEIKYLIDKASRDALLQVMNRYMCLDEYGHSLICNIYYDTPQKLLVRRSLEKPDYKEKFRIRSYGVASLTSPVYMEIKKKYDGVVYKRRVDTTEWEAVNYMNRDRAISKKNQVTDEIDYFKKHYKGLEPAMYISYEREAFYGKEDRELRITLDENILYREDDLSLASKPYGKSLLKKDTYLMEIKVAGAMPLWLVKALSELKIYRTSFSKYGFAYMETLKENKEDSFGKYEETGGLIYA
ncbi:MAG: polyphosphate polymerase domain-containing protein [Acetatifactor sp.]|nr:polyphosphate polymerase domain-containing protein [Acetatifactor sp.]